jgi:hypothetical protein
MPEPHRIRRAALLLAAITLAVPPAARAADNEQAAAPATYLNKLTVAYYDFSSGTMGLDINIRHTFKSSTAWVGGYHEDDGFDQARIGWEYDYHRNWLTVVPTILAASHGFVGATVYAEAGTRLFAIGGFGRTNLEPYWNLAFDPNDYFQAGGGYRDAAGNTLSVYTIRDNRLDTGQTNTHIFFRRHFPDQWRLTIDAVSEHGDSTAGLVVNSWAVSVDVDWRRWFLRVARDPYVNYTPDHQVRIATGLRF